LWETFEREKEEKIVYGELQQKRKRDGEGSEKRLEKTGKHARSLYAK